MKKNILFFLFLLLVVPSVFFFYLFSRKEAFLTNKIKNDFQAVTGMEITIQGLKVNNLSKDLFVWDIEVPRMRIRNPKDFKIPNMALVQDIRFQFEVLPLFSHKWKIHNFHAYVSRAGLVMNQKNQLNAASLASLQASVLESDPSQAEASNFYAERVEIMFGVLYSINSYSSPPQLEKRDLGKKVETYQGVNDPNVLIQVPVAKFLGELNQGSMGLRRGKIQENIAKHVNQ